MSGLDFDEAVRLQRQLLAQQAQRPQTTQVNLLGNPGSVVQFLNVPAGTVQTERLIDTQLPTGPTTGRGFSVSFGIQEINNPVNLNYVRAFVRFGAAGGSFLSGQIDLKYGQTISVPGTSITVDIDVAAGLGGPVTVLVGAFATLEAFPRVTTANEVSQLQNLVIGAPGPWFNVPAIYNFAQRFRVFTSDNANDHIEIQTLDNTGNTWYRVEQAPGSVPVVCPLHSLIRTIQIRNIGAFNVVRANVFFDIEL